MELIKTVGVRLGCSCRCLKERCNRSDVSEDRLLSKSTFEEAIISRRHINIIIITIRPKKLAIEREELDQ